MLYLKDDILKSAPLAEGGEGYIYEYDNDHVLKVYKDSINKKEKLEKITRLSGKKLPQSVIAPLDTVYDKKKNFIGFIMKKVEGETLKKITNKKFLSINNIKFKDILKIMKEIKETLKELHRQRIYISDFNDYNILFDVNYNVYFIDVDSWTVDDIKCDVCMDLFKDPLLIENNFSADTDNYAFALLLFKSLTRLHPFGGTTAPDMDILERMEKRISVLDNPSVIIPKTVDKWNFIPPAILRELKEIFESDKRTLVDGNLDDFYQYLTYCQKDDDYYYSKFAQCPLCYDNAQIIIIPVTSNADHKPLLLVWGHDEIKFILSQDTYIDKQGFVVHKNSHRKANYIFGNKYLFSNDGSITYTINDTSIMVSMDKEYTFPKLGKSAVLVRDTKVYYVTQSSSLVELNVSPSGNYTYNLAKVSFNNIFEVADAHNYFVCNIYDKIKVFNVSGYIYTLPNDDMIVQHGTHFDPITKLWLFIMENSKGQFLTYIFNKNCLVYESRTIKYVNSLDNLCFSNGIIYESRDKIIRGLNYHKGIYKDFTCEAATEGSKLHREGSGFLIINEREIYRFG